MPSPNSLPHATPITTAAQRKAPPTDYWPKLMHSITNGKMPKDVSNGSLMAKERTITHWYPIGLIISATIRKITKSHCMRFTSLWPTRWASTRQTTTWTRMRNWVHRLKWTRLLPESAGTTSKQDAGWWTTTSANKQRMERTIPACSTHCGMMVQPPTSLNTPTSWYTALHGTATGATASSSRSIVQMPPHCITGMIITSVPCVMPICCYCMLKHSTNWMPHRLQKPLNASTAYATASICPT